MRSEEIEARIDAYKRKHPEASWDECWDAAIADLTFPPPKYTHFDQWQNIDND